jgi:20S proteasome alpha/beta subunit
LTVIVALGCSDGVILASDSAASDEEVGTKQPYQQKIQRLGQLPILYGFSGDIGLNQKIDDALMGFQLKTQLKRIRQDLKQLVKPELQEALEGFVPFPQPGFNRPPVGIALFVGIHDGGPWILEIERNGTDTFYNEQLGYFCAIGSGKPWAQAVMRPHLWTPRTLEQGKVFAYRVIEDAIELAMGGLAKPIRLWTLSTAGEVTTVDSEEDERLQETCQLWRALEAEAVGKLFAPKSEGASGEATAPPEPTEQESPEAPDAPSSAGS